MANTISRDELKSKLDRRADFLLVETLRRWSPTPRRWGLGAVDEATVDGDRDRLQLALDALIENAVKHTRERDTIEVSMRRRDGTVTIGVRDTGVGIPAADLDRIFGRFARADPGRACASITPASSTATCRAAPI